MDYVIMGAQLMLSLSILIVLHEMGHFFPARWFNTRVEKFYLFFDPWFELFKIKKGDTEYGIGWLPLGGYVKISGMIDESMDKEQMAQPPQPWEFRSKPAWQRLIIMLGGVTVNFILGFFIYSMVLWYYGETYLPNDNVKYGIAVDSLGMKLGLQDGDKVISIDTLKMEKFNDRTIVREIVLNNAKQLNIERNGQAMSLDIAPEMTSILTSSKNKNKDLFAARFPFFVDSIPKKSPSRDAGLQKGDQIIGINGTSTEYYHQFIKQTAQLKGKETNLQIIRNGTDTLTKSITLTEKGKIGAFNKPMFDLARQEYGFWESFPIGTKKGWSVLTDQFKAYGRMFKGEIAVTESLGGFGSIASLYGYSWNWERFWTMTGLLSLILAFMNLLPIPALDGGHVMFLLYEVISGRKPSDRFMEIATVIGFIIVLALVLFANGMDIKRAIFG